MSEKAKEACGYIAKPVHPTCANCGAYASDRVYPDWMVRATQPGGGGVRVGLNMSPAFSVEEIPESYKEEKNKRCTDHGFVVLKTATCSKWRAKEATGAAA